MVYHQTKGTVALRCCGRQALDPPMPSSPLSRSSQPENFQFSSLTTALTKPPFTRSWRSGRSRHWSNRQGWPHGLTLCCEQGPHWVHSDTGQHHDAVLIVDVAAVFVAVLVVVVIVLFPPTLSSAGDALWSRSECFGRERLFSRLLLRCSRICRRHKVASINMEYYISYYYNHL